MANRKAKLQRLRPYGEPALRPRGCYKISDAVHHCGHSRWFDARSEPASNQLRGLILRANTSIPDKYRSLTAYSQGSNPQPSSTAYSRSRLKL